MATIVLSAVGAAAGASFGGSVFGIGAAAIGRAVGASLGRVVDQSLLGAGGDPVETGRVDRFRLTGAGEGEPVPRLYGRHRLGGQVIWASRFIETVTRSGGGKGAPSRPNVDSYSYAVSLAIALCEGPISRVGRVWADGVEIARDRLDMRVYPGDESQRPDPKIEAVEGTGAAPAYRGIAYVVIEDLDLGPFGNRVPQFSFEVMRPVPRELGGVPEVAQLTQAVAVIPGSGEYTLATTPVYLERAPGDAQAINVNTPLGGTDFTASLETLSGELPECGAASLVVSWFGSDLRCGMCKVAPKVEQGVHDPQEMPWRAGGIGRSAADQVPMEENRPVYGGTPADGAVIEAIAAMREAGLAAMFYPFVLMEQMPDNGLLDPYGGTEQPALPWRGRITLSKAPGQGGSPDGTEQARDEVASFFGDAQPAEFVQEENGVRYTGPDEWSYRRFILHYAHLCVVAGGVSSFCIGSELRGLTRIRGPQNAFPAVEELRRLAEDVRSIVGSGTKIGYAADWSEYFGYHPQDGSGDVFFNLDRLWADPQIDFIGIDNYMPIADWRDGDAHADAAAGAIHSLDYLRGNIAGGEGFDWYYASKEARAVQLRSPIADDAHGEPWVFRYKDLVSWWSRPHHERIGGTRQSAPTLWTPRSKPIWFTEIGCAAIDKGANQPNKFVDPKSSESALPRHSNGRRDDLMQMQYLRAMLTYWSEADNNPLSDVYDAPMVDPARIFVWAWDARPFPFFPGNRALWSDGENHARGHWLTGRASNRDLGGVVREICAASGVRDVDVSRLHGALRGYLSGQTESARASLQPLMMAYGFDAVEREGQLHFISRNAAGPARVVDAEQLAVTEELPEGGRRVRMPDAERIGRVRLTHVDANADYRVGATEAVLPGTEGYAVSQSEMPLLLTEGEAQDTAERWLAEARAARDRISLALPPSRSDLGSGDLILHGGVRYRIDQVTLAGHRSLEAVRSDDGLHGTGEGDQRATRLAPYIAPGPVLPLMLDLPLMTGDEAPHAPHVAASARNWPGQVAVHSAPGTEGYRFETLLDRPATTGTLSVPLPAAASGLYDRRPGLRVKLLSGELSSVDDTTLLAGANLVALGDGTGDWEMIQFREARLVGPAEYELRMLLRGQLGTDALMPEMWPVGTRAVLVDPAVVQLGLAPTERGLLRRYRIGPAALSLSDPSYRELAHVAKGVGLRPYAPVHLAAHPVLGGGLRLSWIRRGRIDADEWERPEIPLGEEREMYLLRVTRGGKILREVWPVEPHWTYDAESRALDGPGASFEIAQVSARYGVGPTAVAPLP